MNIRIAAAIFVLLTLSVAVGLSALPDNAHSPTPENAVYIQTARSAAPEPDIGHCALILALLIGGAAAVGRTFFAPRTPKGSRTSGTLSAVVMATTDELPGTRPVRPAYPERRTSPMLFVERARRGLAHLHQELEVVLGLLQSVDQQIDRLVRVQTGQYAAQLVQYRRLVGVEQ